MLNDLAKLYGTHLKTLKDGLSHVFFLLGRCSRKIIINVKLADFRNPHKNSI